MQLFPALGFFAALFFAALLGTRFLITLLTRRQVIDIPNERSSHAVPKPRGGGIAVVAVMLVGWIGWLAATDGLALTPLVIAAMMLVLASLSFIDDMRNLPARLRLIVQAVAVAAGLLVTLPDEGFTGGLLPVWLEIPIAGCAWLWFVNLFNFMDGIDGITGVETISIGAGMIGLTLLGGTALVVQLPALAMVAAIAGFLVWNWQPSKIFIGDVASIPLGYVIGWMLLETAGASEGFSGWAAALLLPGYYLFDATYTLARRILRRENLFEAHRQHFYQRAIRNGFSHAGTCLAIAAVNVALIVLALVVAPDYPLPALGAGYVVVIALCLRFRHGENKTRATV